MTATAARRLRRRSLGGIRSLHRLHWLVVALSLLATASAWWFTRHLEAERGAARFDREATRVVEHLVERMNRYEDALQAGVAAIAARGGNIDREAWRAFAATLDIDRRYPGIHGIGVIRHVSAEELDALVAHERRLDPSFVVHPEHDAPEHYPIVHVEPRLDNREAIGLDMAHEAHRLDGVRRAVSRGTPQITAPIVLVQDETRTSGFLFFAPWPGRGVSSDGGETPVAAFDGLVYAPFVVGELMAGTLATERRRVLISIDDDGEIIHDEHRASAPGYDADPLFSRTVEVPLYGRTWRFDIRSNLAFRGAASTHQPTQVLVGGLVIDAMLIALFVGLSRTERALVRIADMHGDLERKAAKLAETNLELERFACVVSHDLKTPLRGIGDLAWYIEEDLAPYFESPAAAPEVAYNLGRLNTQVRRMNALIDGILDYSAAGGEVVRVERFDTRELFEEIADGLDLAPGQLVLAPAMPPLESCRTRFAQVMGNIVGNAFKYHPERARARVTVSVAPVANGYRFSIADDGAGIDPRFHDRIFEMFQTLQPSDDTESTGVGLSIVRKSLDGVGGSVRVESSPGHGTTFHVDWPLVTPRDTPLPKAA